MYSNTDVEFLQQIILKILHFVLDSLHKVEYTGINKEVIEMQFTVSEARRYRDLTQEEVAEYMGISRSSYIYLEKNPEKMTIERARKFSDAVDIPIENIIFLSDNSTFCR